jgi:signal transduction histidine kinase
LPVLIVLLFFAAQPVSGQDACPPPPNYVENPLVTPGITASEVAANPTADNLRMFALAARDYLFSIGYTNQLQLAHAFCFLRQEGGDWRSGGIFPIAMSFNPEVIANRQAPIDMRVFLHASTMAHGGRIVKPEIAEAILLAAANDFDRASGLSIGGPVPRFGGHALFLGPYVLLVGFDLQEPHLDPRFIDSHHIPQVTAGEVVDRASLKVFVNEAIHYIGQLSETHGFAASQAARGAFRDRNGPWIAGPVYLFMLDPAGYTVFHGAFPDRYEYRLTGRARDAVTGELLLPQILAAAEQEGGGFVEYHFDNPEDDSDSAEIPKVTYARKFIFSYQHPLLARPVSRTSIMAAGFYPGVGTGSGIKMTRSCADRGIAASAVQTLEDIQPFVECAAEYLAEHGAEEARRAFNEDERWQHGPTYVFVDGIAESGTESQTFVFPPDPSREGQLWGEAIDDFGTDLFYEAYRMMSLVDSGWLYYSFPNPATGRDVPKASYVIEVDWEGSRAVIGAGLYARDWPGTCYPDEVSAAVLDADPSPQTLREFVRCAAMMVASEGYFAKEELERNARWTDGSNYVFVLDTMGNQVMTGSQARIDGKAPHEWGSHGAREDQFGGRDLAAAADTFGEAHVYYRTYNPETGAYEPKVGFLKRVDAQGVGVLVGGGYYVEPGHSASGPSCADNSVTAAGVRTQSDVKAFVQCAAEYAMEHGTEEARRAFNEDERWKHGPTYVFVDGLEPSGEDAFAYVFPPDPAREGMPWGESIDGFGNDYYYELHRIMSLVDEGWIYYAFNNPATGREQPKSSYVIEIDWNGERASIGAGIYAPDFPGACEPDEVHAAALRGNSDDQKLREFVNCAAMTVETSGYFAGPALSNDPRWKQGPIYVFGINAETGTVAFSGSESSFAGSGRFPELLFDGRDAIEAVSIFGEGFWYYNFYNPATQQEEPKVSFVKLVRAEGVPLLVGSGHRPVLRQYRPEQTGN